MIWGHFLLPVPFYSSNIKKKILKKYSLTVQITEKDQLPLPQ